MISINMEKAREIHRDKIRLARNSLFRKLDIEFQRALEDNNDTSDIISRKNALRDSTQDPLIESATDTETLKSTSNVELLGPSPYSQV